MHKRSLLVGIGLGIIIGALLLELFQLGQKSEQQLTEIEQQLNEVASPTPSVEPTSEAETMPDASPEATNEQPKQTDTVETEELESPKAPNTPEVNNAEPLTEPSVDEVAKPKTSYILRVRHGDPIKKTAEQLVEHGVIEDADAFINYFKKKDSLIRAGYFEVEEQSDLEDLRKLFTSQPLTKAEATKQISEKSLTLIE